MSDRPSIHRVFDRRSDSILCSQPSLGARAWAYRDACKNLGLLPSYRSFSHGKSSNLIRGSFCKCNKWRFWISLEHSESLAWLYKTWKFWRWVHRTSFGGNHNWQSKSWKNVDSAQQSNRFSRSLFDECKVHLNYITGCWVVKVLPPLSFDFVWAQTGHQLLNSECAKLCSSCSFSVGPVGTGNAFGFWAATCPWPSGSIAWTTCSSLVKKVAPLSKTCNESEAESASSTQWT